MGCSLALFVYIGLDSHLLVGRYVARAVHLRKRAGGDGTKRTVPVLCKQIAIAAR